MTTKTTLEPTAGPSTRSIAKATAVALLVAIAVLFTTVLPAEYGIDPLKTGRMLGLLNIAASASAAPVTITAASGGPLVPQPNGYKVDAIEFSLVPMGAVEYKYQLEKGATMVYSWAATAPIEFDMHTEPAGKPKEASDSFEAGKKDRENGSYTAPYAGIHGWYWKNNGDKDVTIRVTTAGFYTAAKMFDESGEATDMEVSDPPPPPTF
jgi:hypothetical protein